MFVVLHYNRQESRPKRPLRKLLQCEARELQYCCQCANTKEKKKKKQSTSFSVWYCCRVRLEQDRAAGWPERKLKQNHH